MPSGPRSFLRLSLGARRKEFCPGSLPRSTVGSLAPRLPPSPPSPHVPFGLSPCRAGPGQRGPGRLHSPHSPRAFAGPPSEPAHLAHFVPSALFSSLRSSEPSAVRSLRSLPKGMERREWIGVRTGTNSPILVLTIYYLFGSSVTHSVCRSVLSSPQPPVPWSFGSLHSPHSLRVLRNEYDE